MDAYLEAFNKTPLVMLLTDAKTNSYGISKKPVGWRVDCLGDMGGFNPTWTHMFDYYPAGHHQLRHAGRLEEGARQPSRSAG